MKLSSINCARDCPILFKQIAKQYENVAGFIFFWLKKMCKWAKKPSVGPVEQGFLSSWPKLHQNGVRLSKIVYKYCLSSNVKNRNDI